MAEEKQDFFLISKLDIVMVYLCCIYLYCMFCSVSNSLAACTTAYIHHKAREIMY